MSDTMSRILKRVFTHPAIGVSATYTPAGGGAAVSLRVVFRNPGVAVPSLGGMTVISDRATADILVSDVPDKPRRGATLVINGVTRKIDEAQADGPGLIWKVTLADG